MRIPCRPSLWTAVLILAACSATETTTPPGAEQAVSPNVPLTDLTGSYKGFIGGLYASGTNTPPSSHDNAAHVAARLLTPRRTNGTISSTGSMIFLLLGFSNAAQEGCGSTTQTSFPPCNSWSFIGQAKKDGQVRKNNLIVFPGAMEAQANLSWDNAQDHNYDIVRTRLQGAGQSEAQVEVVWFKIANVFPTLLLPASNADAYQLVISTGNAIRAMKHRYPNLAQVFLGTRIYGGYTSNTLNPEPYAYESAFAAKWVIQAQINQRLTGTIDPRAGDLGSNVAPWVGWGPYLWANGTTPRRDGLTWVRGDFESDGTHPSKTGETKVAQRMLAFFKTSPYSACWFLSTGVC